MPRLSEQARKNKVAYNIKRNRELYKQFNLRILTKDYEELMQTLEEFGMNKAEFLRWAHEELKKQKKD